jgi:penicillin-binding protein 2
MAKAKLVHGKADFKDNAWFVGVTPRRNPEIVVAVLFEGGEHGPLAARVASQVVKAYVEKQRRLPTKIAKGAGKIEVGAVWSAPDADGETLQSGHFQLDLHKTRPPVAAAAPGLE